MAAILFLGAVIPQIPARAQSFGGPGYMRALDLEQQEKFPAAAAAYRAVLAHDPTSLPGLLGLERVYAQLGRADSLLPIVNAAIARQPHVAAIRTIKLRTLNSLGREDEVRASFARWCAEWPGDPQPYEEYAKLLLQDGRTLKADSVLRQGQATLGSDRAFQYEIAQVRASTGQWAQSAAAWRRAVTDNSYLDQAAVFSLSAVSEAARPQVRAILAAPPITAGARRILAALELGWGSPQQAWLALKDLPPDSSAVAAWLSFAGRAEEVQSWLTARDALMLVLAHKHDASVATRAATDALSGGDAESAVALAGRAEPGMDSAEAASTVLPVHLRALSTLGRPQDATRLLNAYAPYAKGAQSGRLMQDVAWGWIRVGKMAEAKALLERAHLGPAGEMDGWIALYQGDLVTARKHLTAQDESASPQLVLALSLLQRTTADSAPEVGQAFLAMARGDTAAAAAAFQQAAKQVPDAATLLLATAAELYNGRHDPHAQEIWESIVVHHPDAPEAPEAELGWARALQRAGDRTEAVQRLEHLILTYPQSALVPQARRELERLQGAIPSTS
ncbi:MAG TPA: tetratricopeptide repeat protein [Gemmatimonadaceae bacterium]|nr:tetratricopeptide repeat protein [Gemmatimonadaceae bacterium]